MIRFGADEDFDNHILRGLRHRSPSIDIVRAQDELGRGASDADVLEWAALTGRIVLSHDASTMTGAAYARIARGAPIPGLILVPQVLGIGAAIDDLVLIAECSAPEEWTGQVRFLPLR